MSDKPVMTDRQLALFRVFKSAIESERGAQKQYEEAASLCDDDALCGILESFRLEEAKHERKLMEMYADYRDRFAS